MLDKEDYVIDVFFCLFFILSHFVVIERRLYTVPFVKQVVCFSEPQGEAAQASSDNDQTPDKNKKKNRCFSCRKKVGLTGKKGTFFTLHTS